ncbi:MAG: dTDP-glucose 4,6-dehydratase [Bacteroidales bacterium]|nr:dTDP-glucose 4,6-dehydratase [Bacteroidales bacterium]
MNSIIITGGAGFIGSHLIHRMVKKYPDTKIINLDALTYAGNLENLKDIENESNYSFVKVDICDFDAVMAAFRKYKPDGIIHLAAESHVDRSITNPMAFVNTNVIGTVNLLNAARELWKDNMEGKKFHHVSTDEVFGSLGDTGFFKESTAYDPRSPYSASKASSDHFVSAYHHTYKIPVVMTNCSNNYGPYQFPEKLIPLMINNILLKKELPIYGKGLNIRDWLYVEDHAAAIDLVFHKGELGESYNIGGKNEWKNIDLVHLLCRQMDEKLGREKGESESLITYVKDRAGHDMRYAIDSQKIEKELGWFPSLNFEEGLSKTIDWYLNNKDWLKRVTSGEYAKYYQDMYKNREV